MWYMDWQGLTIERKIHPLTLEEGTAEIDHYHQEIHGNYMLFKLPMGLCESLATYMLCCQSLLRTSNSERSERGSHEIRITLLPPSDSEWDSVSMASEMSFVNRRQRGEGTYDPKMDKKIFLPKLTDDSTKEACWMWRADALDLIEKGYSERAMEVEIKNSLASCSRGLWFREKCLLGHSILQILNDMKRSSPGEVGIQCDTLLRTFYELSQKGRTCWEILQVS